ncbi:nickel-dependent hydrogenase large subunit [Achromobacter xylosoxidans]|uniref:hydrogenase large subunit n=1 Tax=Alcaligenes xylosoxydans xylosoxydans TaxID=85698 RepID=UPI0006C899FB|nr:nickel-dependent hydrogenase large subunit [Achromobacter xylosoxidans]
MSGPRLRDVDGSELTASCEALLGQGGCLRFAYGWYPEAGEALELRYVVSAAPTDLPAMWRCRPRTAEVPSLAGRAPLMAWYEREISDLCGVVFAGSPQPYPLLLLPGATAYAPLLRLGSEDPAIDYRPQPSDLPEIGGPARGDIQRLPYGPIRADVVESAQFVFLYIGEAILHYQPQLFFKHRGMERRFEGRAQDLAAILAERVSGVGSVAHALAYCQAIEVAADCTVPPRAALLRVVVAELERLYNHLHYLGHLCHTTTLKVGEAQGKYLEERIKQLNGRLTGSRFLRNLLVPGGLRADLDTSRMGAELDAIAREFATYSRMLEASTPHLDRLITTGFLDSKVAEDQGATGPVERASGAQRDLRRDLPYAAYGRLPVTVALRRQGDAYARQQVRIAELESSVDLIRAAISLLRSGPVRTACEAPAASEGLGWAESPRGALYYAVHVGADGRLARVKIKSPSFSNWRAFPFTVHDSNMMDYAINEASFGLTIAGCDR